MTDKLATRADDAPHQPDLASPPVSWAIVGTGAVSRSIAPDFALADGARLTTVSSRTPESARTFAADLGSHIEGRSFEELLDDDRLDALYIATPHATHERLAIRALEAGKHVLVEKPIGVDGDEARRIQAAAERMGRFAMEAMWMKFNPSYLAMLSELRDGVIGEVMSVRASFGLPFPADHGSRWSAELRGSTMLDQGIYPVTLALDVLGEPGAVAAIGTVRPNGVDLREHVQLEYEDGRYAQLAASMVEFVEPTASISGTLGWIHIPFPFWAGSSYTVFGGDHLFEPRAVTMPREGNGFTPMIAAASDAIARGWTEHPIHPWAAVQRTFSVLDRARSALTTQRNYR
jgi:predicted dehydrogenase